MYMYSEYVYRHVPVHLRGGDDASDKNSIHLCRVLASSARSFLSWRGEFRVSLALGPIRSRFLGSFTENIVSSASGSPQIDRFSMLEDGTGVGGGVIHRKRGRTGKRW